jgi:hypothetical protein
MDRSLQADDQDKQRSVYNFAPRIATKLVRAQGLADRSPTAAPDALRIIERAAPRALPAMDRGIHLPRDDIAGGATAPAESSPHQQGGRSRRRTPTVLHTLMPRVACR